MEKFSYVNLPRDFVFILNRKGLYSNTWDRSCFTILKNNKALHRIVELYFDWDGSFDNLFKKFGKRGFIEHLGRIYLYRYFKNLYPASPEDTEKYKPMMDNIMAFDRMCSEPFADDSGRAILLGFYLKILTFSKVNIFLKRKLKICLTKIFFLS